MAVERTFLCIKPDGVSRNLAGKLMERFYERGYVMVAAKMMTANEELLNEHYAEHAGRPFLPGLVSYMKSGPVLAMVWEGENIIAQSRKMMGATRPDEAAPGTIRGDFCQQVGRNVIHGSDGPEAAKREIALWFKPEEIAVAYENAHTKFMFE